MLVTACLFILALSVTAWRFKVVSVTIYHFTLAICRLQLVSLLCHCVSYSLSLTLTLCHYNLSRLPYHSVSYRLSLYFATVSVTDFPFYLTIVSITARLLMLSVCQLQFCPLFFNDMSVTACLLILTICQIQFCPLFFTSVSVTACLLILTICQLQFVPSSLPVCPLQVVSLF